MKIVLSLAVAITALCFSQKSHALPASNDVSTRVTVSTAGVEPGRMFDAARTDFTVGCSDAGPLSSGDCKALPHGHCDRWTRPGWYPNGNQCCDDAYICKDGVPSAELIAQAEARESQPSDLDQVFGSDRTLATYWGYLVSIAKSPNAGRNLLIEAKLDVCLGWSNVDAIINSSPDIYSQWTACTGSSYCGGTVKNTSCNANSGQVCIDRCNCKYQQGLISLGYPDPGCSNL